MVGLEPLTIVRVAVGVQFPAPAPFTEGQFEKVVGPLKGTIVRGMGQRPTGEQVPLLVCQLPSGDAIIYELGRGFLSFEVADLGRMLGLENTVIAPLFAVAGVKSEEVTAEVDITFISDASPTALAKLQGKLPKAPPEISKLFGGEAVGWGWRFVRAEAMKVIKPFRDQTPWLEYTVEPFANNPRKILTKILARDEGWSKAKIRLQGAEKEAVQILKVLVE